MGQPVAVIEKPASVPGVVRFEANRNLTGQGHERFRSSDDAVGDRPAAELARRMFSTGRVGAVHIYSNIITVDLQKGFTSEGLADVVRDLYQYWKPGMAPPAFAEPEPEAAPASATPAVDGGGDAALSEAAKRVPAHLLERSRQARERWASKEAG